MPNEKNLKDELVDVDLSDPVPSIPEAAPVKEKAGEGLISKLRGVFGGENRGNYEAASSKQKPSKPTEDNIGWLGSLFSRKPKDTYEVVDNNDQSPANKNHKK